MRGVFDDKELEEPKARGDKEVTLGTGAVFLIVFGLLVLCGLCFGMGYAVGHRGGQSNAAAGQPPADAQMSAENNGAQANGSLPKPSATVQTAVPAPVQNATPGDGSQTGTAGQPQSAGAASTPIAVQPASNPATQQSTPSNQPVVRPALPATAAQTVSASSAQPAAPPAVSIMVQIAAVSHEEDADVLVGALRKHGYQVSAQREPADNLIHVRIGPFNDRNEANRWRLKLLNDGYNALIQP